MIRAATRVSPIFLAMVFCCFMSAQTGTSQASKPSTDALNPSEALKTIDQLIEQNQQLEKQNQQLMEQIKVLRGAVDQNANVSHQAAKAPSAQSPVGEEGAATVHPDPEHSR